MGQEHEMRSDCKVWHDDFVQHKLESVPVRDSVKKNELEIEHMKDIIRGLDETDRRHKAELVRLFSTADERIKVVEDSVRMLCETTKSYMEWMKEQKDGKQWLNRAVAGLAFGVGQGIIVVFLIKYLKI